CPPRCAPDGTAPEGASQAGSECPASARNRSAAGAALPAPDGLRLLLSPACFYKWRQKAPAYAGAFFFGRGESAVHMDISRPPVCRKPLCWINSAVVNGQ